jgi:hypothetical protein
MSIGFPTNTVVMIIVTMIASGASSWFILSRGLGRLPVAQHVRRTWRWGAALLLITWLLVRLALAVYPPGGTPLATQFSITFTLAGLGFLAGILPLLISPVFRQVVHTVPETWLIGLHAIRLAGFLFLALLDMKLLPAEFALSAGYGDMTVGLLALGLVYLFAQRRPAARALAIGWNLLGLLDFVAALTTGFIYLTPFAVQLAASGVPQSYLNYVLIIPSFGVPLYASLHIYSLFQLLSGRVRASNENVETPVQASVFQEGQPSIQP